MNVWTPEKCSKLREVSGDLLRPGGLALTGYLFDLADFRAGSRILDAGCGTGATLRYIADTRRLQTVGVDSSMQMLTEARSSLSEPALVCASIEGMPFGAAGFDGIICECVLSQTDASRTLAEFQRLLRVNGLLLLSDLYLMTTGAAAGTSGETGCLPASREQLETLLEDAGFRVEHWEDRSADLRRLAVQLILSPERQDDDGLLHAEEIGIHSRDIGYCLLTARKMS
ncbi:MAG: class I SAM-dependent methyltransferase [Deltaproteobacteria bacterium]|nr:class I SAM-dependent methyltransferase [Deltaproteobacteria bacterium]